MRLAFARRDRLRGDVAFDRSSCFTADAGLGRPGQSPRRRTARAVLLRDRWRGPRGARPASGSRRAAAAIPPHRPRARAMLLEASILRRSVRTPRPAAGEHARDDPEDRQRPARRASARAHAGPRQAGAARRPSARPARSERRRVDRPGRAHVDAVQPPGASRTHAAPAVRRPVGRVVHPHEKPPAPRGRAARERVVPERRPAAPGPTASGVASRTA